MELTVTRSPEPVQVIPLAGGGGVGGDETSDEGGDAIPIFDWKTAESKCSVCALDIEKRTKGVSGTVMLYWRVPNFKNFSTLPPR